MKYPIGGYAPGNYMCRCVTCKEEFKGDKRAVQCEPCGIMGAERLQGTWLRELGEGTFSFGHPSCNVYCKKTAANSVELTIEPYK